MTTARGGRPAVPARTWTTASTGRSSEILDTPEVQHVFDEHQARHGGADAAGADRAGRARPDRSSVDDIDELADTYASGGASVTYHRDMFSEHMLLHPMSAPMTLRWLTDRFAGRPLAEHLIRTKWPTLFNPMTYVGMARLAASSRRWSRAGRWSVLHCDAAGSSAPSRLRM